MANQVVAAGESREQVAYKLLHDILSVEGKNVSIEGSTTREEILKTYYQCWLVANGNQPR